VNFTVIALCYMAIDRRGKPLSFLIIWFHETELVIIGQQGKKYDDKINAEARLVP